MKSIFSSADILLPAFHSDSDKMSRYSTIACDQFTSEPEYWQDAEKITKGEVTTLDLVLPEIYLCQTDSKAKLINKATHDYLNNVYKTLPDAYVYVERTLISNGKIRRGIIGVIDLECYDYNKGSSAPVRASEGTVLSRIPPRLKIRREACLELPHIMLFCDDEKKELIEPLADMKAGFEPLYDFDLMLGSGNIKGWSVNDAGKKHIDEKIAGMSDKAYCRDKYGIDGVLLFAVGDGNHSLATAKACYEELKAVQGDKALESPARYALCEVVNIHDAAIEFEPIYRLLNNCTQDRFFKALSECRIVSYTKPDCLHFKYTLLSKQGELDFYITEPKSALAVGEIQDFLDGFLHENTAMGIDYIHGIDSIKTLSQHDNCLGIVFDGMKKSELFPSVIKDGALPRKTFSMGEAKDKRFYLEARKIK